MLSLEAVTQCMAVSKHTMLLDYMSKLSAWAGVCLKAFNQSLLLTHNALTSHSYTTSHTCMALGACELTALRLLQ